jgi:synaptosomal-associated protein 23/synaptosomal-associated protein 25
MSSDEQMRSEADRVTNESLAVTRRIHRLGLECVATAAATLSELERQGRQLEGIETRLDGINGDCKKVEKMLHKMEKTWGLFVLPWKRHRKFEKTVSRDVEETKPRKDDDIGVKSARGNGATAARPHDQPVLRMQRVLGDAREDEMEQNLQAMCQLVGVMREQALTMGGVLDEQNEQIPRIMGKVDSNEVHVRCVNDRTVELLNSS